VNFLDFPHFTTFSLDLVIMYHPNYIDPILYLLPQTNLKTPKGMKIKKARFSTDLAFKNWKVVISSTDSSVSQVLKRHKNRTTLDPTKI